MEAALWLVWLVVATLALVGELLTLGLFFGSLAVAALVTAGSATVLPVAVQVLVFCAVSLLLLLAVRPAALRLLPRGSTDADLPRVGPVGQRGLATDRITSLQGQIRIGSGEFWSARPDDASTSIEVGGEVEVIRLDGLTAVVRPVNQAGRRSVEPSSEADPYGLTAREIEVLELLALGLSNADIAARLVLSQRTVDHHVGHILDKTGASSRLEAVRLGLEQGIIRLNRASSD